jgi:hypothetical protein
MSYIVFLICYDYSVIVILTITYGMKFIQKLFGILCGTILNKMHTLSILHHVSSYCDSNKILHMNHKHNHYFFMMDADSVSFTCQDGKSTFAEGFFLVILCHV